MACPNLILEIIKKLHTIVVSYTGAFNLTDNIAKKIEKEVEMSI